jgi:hypothetical protein
MQQHLELCYLYRDSGNFKWYQSLIFPLRGEPNLSHWEQTLRTLMPEGMWIKPFEMRLPLIADAPHDEELHEVFYELHQLAFTEEPPNQQVFWEDWLEALPTILARFDRAQHYATVGSLLGFKNHPPFEIQL